MVQSEQAGLAQAQDEAQGRAMAWSGVRAVMSVLNDQREQLLNSEMPALRDQYTLYEVGGRAGVVRLLPVGGEGRRLVAESAKIDLNRATSAMLEATGRVEGGLAEEIVATREGSASGVFQSVGELLGVEGMTPEILYGVPEAPVGDADLKDGESATATGLASVVTVYGVEPALQRSGKLRINLNVPWSDELGNRVTERFGDQAAAGLKQVFEGGTAFEDEAKLYQVLRFFNVTPGDWPDVVDTFTAAEWKYHYGRVNINVASEEVLLALPEITPEQAAALVQIRDDLDENERNSVAWPAIQGVVNPEQYDDLAGWLTTRSWTFRLRLMTGEVDMDEPDGPLQYPLIYEVVIDLASPRPRVAYLRDITMRETAERFALAEISEEGIEPESEGDEMAEFGGETGEMLMNEEETVGEANSAEAGRIAPRRIGRWRKVSQEGGK